MQDLGWESHGYCAAETGRHNKHAAWTKKVSEQLPATPDDGTSQ